MRRATLRVVVVVLAIVGAAATASPAPGETPPAGYWLAAADGGVFTFGEVGFHGSTAETSANAVGLASTESGAGYWVVSNRGTVVTFGDAPYYGGVANPAAAVTATLVPTPSGHGYWIATLDGGVFTFGDAQFYGSTGGMQLTQPVVGMAATPSGHGYWLVALDGGVFTFGDAQFYGSTGGMRLAQPVVGMAATPSGHGYWLVALDGGVFTFGDAQFYGSTGGMRLAQPVVGMARPGSATSGSGFQILGESGASWPGPGEVALTFDDGPTPAYTPRILAVLSRYRVRATFFEVGSSVNAWPYLSKSVHEAGHSVQNHSWSHPQLPRLSDTELRSQLLTTSDAIQAATGVRPTCLRPPGGGTSDRVISIAQSVGLDQVLWNVNPSDYLRPGAAAIIQRALHYADGRPLVIGMHDGGGPRDQTVAALPSIIEGLRSRGYDFVSLCG